MVLQADSYNYFRHGFLQRTPLKSVFALPEHATKSMFISWHPNILQQQSSHACLLRFFLLDIPN
jgi:hypothetical protein